MINTADMINAAFKANKQQLCPASTSQSAASSDPTITIPGPSSHITATPSIVSSATDTLMTDTAISDMINLGKKLAEANEYFRMSIEFFGLKRQALELEPFMEVGKRLVYRKRYVKLWMNDVRKATIKFGDIGDEMCMEMSRLQAQGHEFDSAETRSVRRRMLLKVKELREEQEELIKRASLYGLGTNNNGGLLQCGTCGSLQANHSIEAVPTYACY